MSDHIIPHIVLPSKTGQLLSLWKGPIAGAARWTMPEILELVCEAYTLRPQDLNSPRRTRKFAWPRQHAMWLMAQQPHLNLSMIGRFLGDRDHTTIRHGVRAHQVRVDRQALLEAA